MAEYHVSDTTNRRRCKMPTVTDPDSRLGIARGKGRGVTRSPTNNPALLLIFNESRDILFAPVRG